MKTNKLRFQCIPKQFTCVGFIVLAIFLSGCQNNLEKTLISQTHPETGTELSVFGWVGVAFSQPMHQESVEKAFTISPNIPGQTFWEDNTFWFRPIQAFDQDASYQAALKGDIETTDGQIIPVNMTWEFSIREPELLYYMREGDLGEVWRSTSAGNQPQQLSNTGGKVYDFAPDQSGLWIAFSVQNSAGGQDLWVMDRDGENQQLLINCQQDICSEPAWSMDQNWLAYSRQIFDEETNGYQPSQIWKADSRSCETAPLFQDKTIFTQFPSFSPDGKKLAVFDITQKTIRVLELQTLEETLIPSTLPGMVNWSSNSAQIMFRDETPAIMEPFIDLYVADLSTGEITTVFPSPTTDTDFSQPSWSPDEEWIAVSLRPVNAGISKTLWVIHLSGGRNITITDDQSATFSSYQWDPWGSSLAYQRLTLGSSDPQVSIWVWDWQTQASLMIVENASRPAWLP